MKKQGIILVVIILVLILLTGFIFYNKNSSSKLKINYTFINNSYLINEFNTCKVYLNSNNLNYSSLDSKGQSCINQWAGNKVEDNNLTKLNLIEGLKVLELCNWDYRKNNTCNIEDYLGKNPEIIWNFKYTKTIVSDNYCSISIFKNNGKYYYVSGCTYIHAPGNEKIFSIEDLNEKIISQLAS